MTLEAFRRFSESGDNIEVVYVASRSRLVIGTESMLEERPGIRMKDAKNL